MSINLLLLFEKRVLKISHVLKFRNKSFEILLSEYPARYNTEHTLNSLFVFFEAQSHCLIHLLDYLRTKD